MAANKFATKLQKNCPKIIVILVYALLEWMLILLLLLNSLLSYLIAKFAKFFGLKPSCTWCSTLDHLNPHFDHVCEVHGAEISNLSFCSAHNKLANSHNLCIRCSSSTPMNQVSSGVAFFTWMSEKASSQGDGKEAKYCSCCHDQILTTKLYPHQSLIFNPTWDLLLEYVHKHKLQSEANLLEKETQFQENIDRDGDGQQGKKAEIVEDSNILEVREWNSSQTTTDDPFSIGCNEEDESVYIADMLLQNAGSMDSDRFICIELIDTEAVAPTLTNSSEDVEEQVEEDDTRFEALAAVEEYEKEDYNLDGEAVVGENEIKMGHESSSIREEAEETEQLKGSRMEALYAELEEEREAAAEAAKETMGMITKLQEEKAAMQMEAAQYQRMMEEQAEYDQEALQLLNDLINKRDRENKQLQKELQMYRTAQNKLALTLSPATSIASSNNTTHSLDLDQEMEEEDISLAEFDEERVSILEQVKALEGKLVDDDRMAKKLLPLFDEEMRSTEASAGVNVDVMMLIQEEMGHVYERLQALEADTDFLKHCTRSMSKGNENEGMPLLKEILQHLRDLKTAMDNTPDPEYDASPINQDHPQFSSTSFPS